MLIITTHFERITQHLFQLTPMGFIILLQKGLAFLKVEEWMISDSSLTHDFICNEYYLVHDQIRNHTVYQSCLLLQALQCMCILVRLAVSSL